MKNKKKILICINNDYNGQPCPRCKSKFNFLELNSMLSDESNCDNCEQPLVFENSDLPKNWSEIVKKVVIFIIFLIIVVGTILLFISKKHSEPKSQETIQTVHQTKDSVTKAPAEKPVEEKVQAPVKQEPALAKPIVKESVKPKTTASAAPKGRQTKTFSDGSKYVGEMKNGKMDGLGTYYYNSEQLISDRDLKKRVASKGDYVTGEWYEGRLVNGKQFDAENNQKAVIIIGR